MFVTQNPEDCCELLACVSLCWMGWHIEKGLFLQVTKLLPLASAYSSMSSIVSVPLQIQCLGIIVCRSLLLKPGLGRCTETISSKHGNFNFHTDKANVQARLMLFVGPLKDNAHPTPCGAFKAPRVNLLYLVNCMLQWETSNELIRAVGGFVI